VHYLVNHVKKRIPGYIPYHSESNICSGNQILAIATQRDCPTVVATKWTNRNNNLYSKAAILYRSRIQRSSYITSPCSNHSIMNCTNAKDSILLCLPAYFDMAAMFDPTDWPDSNNSGQSRLWSLGFWHGRSCILLGVNNYPTIINLAQQLGQMQSSTLIFYQLVVIASDQQVTITIIRPKDVWIPMEPDGSRWSLMEPDGAQWATSRYNLIQIWYIRAVMDVRDISVNIRRNHRSGMSSRNWPVTQHSALRIGGSLVRLRNSRLIMLKRTRPLKCSVIWVTSRFRGSGKSIIKLSRSVTSF
jgi:hypothetical protein